MGIKAGALRPFGVFDCCGYILGGFGLCGLSIVCFGSIWFGAGMSRISDALTNELCRKRKISDFMLLRTVFNKK
jgi:hypothetical protein